MEKLSLKLPENIVLKEYKATIKKIIDADTFDVFLDLGFGVFFQTRIRLYGCNAFETSGLEKEKGLKAKEFTTQLLENQEVIIQDCGKPDKYGRNLAKITFNNKDLAKLLIKEGHAVEYYG